MHLPTVGTCFGHVSSLDSHGKRSVRCCLCGWIVG
jgi:hypothetical protein